MEATCQLCGCTEERPCDMMPGGPCHWIDPQQDLCSVCAHKILLEPIVPRDLAEVTLQLRAHRACLLDLMSLAQTTQR